MGLHYVGRVKDICREKRIPISRLEKDLGFANGYIGHLKEGNIPYDRLKKIADYLNVSIAYLVGEKEEETEEIDADIRRIRKAFEKMSEHD